MEFPSWKSRCERHPSVDLNGSMVAGRSQAACYECWVAESMAFGQLIVRFDDQVLRPRPWTVAQSAWAAEVFDDVPDGALLELCAGVGQIGLLLASLVSRDIVLVDADENACTYARANAAAAGLSRRVDVRNGPMREVLAPEERFALVLADPPWVRSGDVTRFPLDPLMAIDGGYDGLELARTCVDLIGLHLQDRGVAILQLGDADQVEGMRSYLHSRPQLGLCVHEVRTTPADNGVLVRLARRA